MSEGKQIKRSVFFISDGTAITAETLGHSLLAQFPHVDFDIHIIPYISSEEAAMTGVAEINQRAERDGQQPLVFDTLVDPYVRDIINTAKALNLDVFEGRIGKLSEVLEIGRASCRERVYRWMVVGSLTYWLWDIL